MNERTAIELKYPIQINGTETSVLHMRRPKVRDQILGDKAKKSGKTDTEVGAIVMANLCEITPQDIESLDLADFKQCDEIYSNFFEPTE